MSQPVDQPTEQLPNSLKMAAKRSSQLGLANGELVADRYRVLRFIARGGMGEVYEVEDLELHERVALKIVRPAVADDERVAGRFRREIQLARRVTHRNVCRIFDLGSHQTELGAQVLFLTMELLEGENLTQRLQRVGPLSPRQALPLVRQMAAALSEAHRAGVVHRDFKSDNVLLVPDGDQERVVVTDFGIARALVSDTDHRSLTVDAILGTPAYIAPEQVEGKTITAAADVYALGIVLYEMMTFRLPFEADTPLAVAVRRLNEPPTHPSVYTPNLDPRWTTVILRCLERLPADRFSSPSGVLDALEGGRLPRRRFRLPKRSPWLWTVSGALAALVLAGLFATASPSLRAARPLVAVLGFKNLAGHAENAWLSTALSEMLSAELAAGGAMRIVPGEDVARMRLELELADADGYAAETLARTQRNLGSDLVLMGSYLAVEGAAKGTLSLVLKLQDARSGETVVALRESGDVAGIYSLLSRVGARLREGMGISRLTAAEGEAVRASLPSDPQAARWYAEGRSRLRAFDAKAAVPLLERAAEREPEHPLIHAALSEALAELGQETAARVAARTAFENCARLGPEERLVVEGRYRMAAREWERAVAVYQELEHSQRDHLEYGLLLAEAQRAAGHLAAALGTLTRLRQLRPPDNDDPRIDIEAATVAKSQGEIAEQLRTATAAVAQARDRGTTLLQARAQVLQAGAYLRSGDAAASRRALASATATFAAAGDGFRVALANVNLGNVLAEQGQHAEARGLFEAAAASCRQQGNRTCEGQATNNLAGIFGDLGQPAAGRHLYEQALNFARENGNRESESRALYNIARMRLYEGDLTGARAFFTEAHRLGQATEARGRIASSLVGLATVDRHERDFPSARARAEQARGICSEIGNKALEAEAWLALAETASADYQFEQAATAAESAGRLGAASEDQSLRLAVAVSRSRAATGLGQAAAAKAELAQALATARRLGLELSGFEVELALAEAERALDHEPEARRLWTDVEHRARAKGCGLVAQRAREALR